jgi:hypothetical protein
LQSIFSIASFKISGQMKAAAWGHRKDPNSLYSMRY